MYKIFFISFIFTFSSCSLLLKTIYKIKNPKILSREKIISNIGLNFENDSLNTEIDMLYNEINDSNQLVDMILDPLQNKLILVSKKNEIFTYKGNVKCRYNQLDSLKQNIDSNIKLSNDSFLNNKYGSLFFENLVDKNNVKLNFKKYNYDYIVPYYWSSIFSYKNNSLNYKIFKSQISSLNKNILILRINCDLRNDLSKNKAYEGKIIFKKNTKGYDVIVKLKDIYSKH